MDVRLLMDGGVPLAAPPGKTVESPPPNEGEFKKILQETESETKEIGEVAETEPKPQLQNLDSEMTQKETPLSLDSTSLLLSLALVQMPSSVQLQESLVRAVQAPALETGVQAIELKNSSTSSPILFDQLEQEVGEEPLLELNVTEVSVVTVNPEQTIVPTESSQKGEQATPISIIEETQRSSSYADQKVHPITQNLSSNVDVPAAKTQTSSTLETRDQHIEETAPATIENISVSSGGNTQSSLSGDASSPESETGSNTKQEFKSETEVQAVAPESKMSSEAKPVAAAAEKVESFRPLDRAERAKVVSQLVERIETLAANSVRNEVKVRMEPAELGTVLVSIRREVEGMTAQLVASDDRVKDALKESRNELSQALAVRGMGSVKIEVGKSESMNLQSNLGQNSSSQNPQEQQPKDQPKQNFAFGKAVTQQPEERTTNRVSIRYGSSLQMEI